MAKREKSVIRFRDGRLLKGYVKDFSPDIEEVLLEEAETGKKHELRIDEMKAVFFVKYFRGDYKYRENKSYGRRKPEGKRVFVRFTDGECLVGFLMGKVPWKKGFFLSGREEGGVKGFFLLPADKGTNNSKVFVVSSSVDDVTVVP